MLGQNQRRVALTLRELLRNASYGEDQNLVPLQKIFSRKKY